MEEDVGKSENRPKTSVVSMKDGVWVNRTPVME
jgi:hypothetical protein